MFDTLLPPSLWWALQVKISFLNSLFLWQYLPYQDWVRTTIWLLRPIASLPTSA
ncbi:MAG: hypothetical protein SW833_05255 [Cyanobacteriota bacterium]|nr:hypothetical protein [Cyanobacteriota bacterium]